MSALESEFQNIYNARLALNEATKEIREKIMALEKEMEAIAEPHELAISEAEARIKNEILVEGKSFKCDFGKATYKKEYERHSWDDKALMGYAAVNPVIEKFRKTTTIPASVSLSVGELK